MNDKNHLLDELFIKYRKLVIQNAWLFVKDYHVAEDICQETFIRLGEHMDSIDPEKRMAWLIRVSERLALDHMRKGGKYAKQVSLDETEEDILSAVETDLSTIFIRKEEAECRKRVLDKLRQEKPLWYEAIMLSDLEGMDNHEIGKYLGISSNLVSVWKRRARHWLRINYERENRE